MPSDDWTFSSKQVDRAQALCEELKATSNAQLVALIDAHGHLICRSQGGDDVDGSALGALAAATMAAHQSLAGLLGESFLPHISHVGARHGIHLCLLARKAIWVVLHDNPRNTSRVADDVLTHRARIDALLGEHGASPAGALDDVSLEDIDNLFDSTENTP